MKAILLLAGAILVTAQVVISNMPECAIQCLTIALSRTGCSLTDLSCICSPYNHDKMLSQARPCLEEGCSKDDLSKAHDFIDSSCGSGASQSLTTQPIASTSATTDTPTSKPSPAATDSKGAGSASKSATTISVGGDSSVALSVTSTATSTTKGGSLPAPSTGGSDKSEPTLSTTSGQSDSSGGGGLSKGAAAGVGVGAGLGVISVITGIAWVFYVRGKNAGKKIRNAEESTDHQNNSTLNSASPPKQFLEVAGNPVAELP